MHLQRRDDGLFKDNNDSPARSNKSYTYVTPMIYFLISRTTVNDVWGLVYATCTDQEKDNSTDDMRKEFDVLKQYTVPKVPKLSVINV